MKTITIPKQKIDTYTFDELSEDIQEELIDKHRESKADDMLELNFCIEDLQERLESDYGFEPVNVYYGLHVQGSGASFEPKINDFEKIINNLVMCNILDIEHLKLIEYYDNGMIELSTYTANHRCSHEYTHAVEIIFNDSTFHLSNHSESILNDLKEAFTEYYRDICRYFYKRIDSEYEYQISDNVIKEDIKANCDSFLKNGETSFCIDLDSF